MNPLDLSNLYGLISLKLYSKTSCECSKLPLKQPQKCSGSCFQCPVSSKSAWRWTLWRLFSITLHLLALALYSYALCYSETNRNRHIQNHPNRFNEDFQRREYLGKWKFLTRWSHMFQLIYFAGALAFDLLTLAVSPKVQDPRFILNHKKKFTFSLCNFYVHFSRLLDLLFHSVVAPIAVLVSVMFWSLFIVNPELVVSKLSVPEPAWLNHTVHSVVCVVALIELIITYRSRPTIIQCSILALAFISAYLSLLFYVGIYRHFWAYGILARLTAGHRVLFVFGVLVLYASLFGILRLLHRVSWNQKRINRFLFGFDLNQNKLRFSELALSLQMSSIKQDSQTAK